MREVASGADEYLEWCRQMRERHAAATGIEAQRGETRSGSTAQPQEPGPRSGVAP